MHRLVNKDSDLEQRYWDLKARFEGLVNAAINGIIIIDEGGKIETFNSGAEQIFGYRADEVIGKNVNVLMPQPYQAEHDRHIANYLATRIPKIIGIGREVSGKRSNGDVFPMDLSVGEIKGRDKTRFVGIARDISARKAVEDALREREQEFRLLFENVPVGIFTMTFDGAFKSANPSLIKFLGYEEAEILNMRCCDLVPQDNRQELNVAIEEITSGKRRTSVIDTKWIASDGRETYVTIHAGLVDVPEKESFIIGQAVDRTSQVLSGEVTRQAREQLAHVDRLTTLGEMATAIAHEINQPLAAIASYAQAHRRLIERKQSRLGEITEAFEHIASQALRAGEVVRRIRSFITRGESSRATVQINDIISMVLELGEVDARSQNVEIHTNYGKNIPAVSVDPVQIQQVCLNLIRNAVDAMESVSPHARSLFIDSKRHDDGIEVSFEDSGPGLADNIHDNLFKPFHTTKDTGMGMGLSISRSIIEEHGGVLRYQQAAGGGAIFSFTLPPAED